MILRPQEDIDHLLNQVVDHIAAGTCGCSGQSYEQGIEAALRWVTGDTDEYPYPTE